MTRSRWSDTDVTRRLGIAYPIFQGPFGGMSSEKLLLTVSEAGGLGCFGANTLSGGQIRELCVRLRRATDKPFAVNLWIPTADQPLYDAPGFEQARARLKPYYDDLDLPIPERPERFAEIFEDQLEAVLDSRPAVFSFIYGAPPPEAMAECRKRGILTIGTATTPEEAEYLEDAGVDMIVATGSEAGGHRASFLTEPEPVLSGLFTLLPQVVDRVTVPVIAAGGIADGRGVAAALALGASAVQVGTAFLACEESAADETYRDILFSPRARETRLTRVFTGRLARSVRTRLLDELEREPAEVAPYPVQNWLTNKIRNQARQVGNVDLRNYWAGQAAPLLRHRSAAALFDAFVTGADEIFG